MEGQAQQRHSQRGPQVSSPRLALPFSVPAPIEKRVQAFSSPRWVKGEPDPWGPRDSLELVRSGLCLRLESP